MKIPTIKQVVKVLNSQIQAIANGHTEFFKGKRVVRDKQAKQEIDCLIRARQIVEDANNKI